jgi:hypothetical protein
MLKSPGSDYCLHHSRHHVPVRANSDAVAEDLLASVEDFSTTASVNRFLANVVRQFAQKRIERPDAIALAYMGQLLLNSVAAMNRENLQAQKEGPTQIIIDIPRPDRTEQLRAQQNKLAAANPDQAQQTQPYPSGFNSPSESKPTDAPQPPPESKPPAVPASEPPKPPGICYGGPLRYPGSRPPSQPPWRGRWTPPFHGPPG